MTARYAVSAIMQDVRSQSPTGRWLLVDRRFLGLLLALILAASETTAQSSANPAWLTTESSHAPALPAALAKRVLDLEEQLAETESRAWTDPADEQRVAGIKEVIRIAEEILQIRLEHQGNSEERVRWRGLDGEPSEWWQIRETRRWIADMNHVLQLTPADRDAIRSALEAESLMMMAYGMSDYRRALSFAEPHLDALSEVLPEDNLQRTLSQLYVGGLLGLLGDMTAADRLMTPAVERLRRNLGPEHAHTIEWTSRLSFLRSEQGRLAEAEALLLESLEHSRRSYGPDARFTVQLAFELGGLLVRSGQLAAADAYRTDALERVRRNEGDLSLYTAAFSGGLAEVRQRQGRLEEAETLRRRAISSLESLGLVGQEPGLRERGSLARLLLHKGEIDGALRLYEGVLNGHLRLYGEQYQSTIISRSGVASCLMAAGEYDRAAEVLEANLDAALVTLGAEHPEVGRVYSGLARAHLGRSDIECAASLIARAVEIAEKGRVDVLGGASRRAGRAAELRLPELTELHAVILARLGRAEEALGVLERGRGRAALDWLAGDHSDARELLQSTGDAERLLAFEKQSARVSAARATLLELEVALYEANRELRRTTRAQSDAETEVTRERHAEAAVRTAEQVHREETLKLAALLQGLVPVTASATVADIAASLRDQEALVSFVWTAESVIALLLRDGRTTSASIATGRDRVARLAEQLRYLRRLLSAPPNAREARLLAEHIQLCRNSLPPALTDVLSGAHGVVVSADGEFQDLPLELLLPEARITYTPSASFALTVRRSPPRDTTSAQRVLVVADPVFDSSEPTPDPPEAGVTLTSVDEGDNAYRAGLRPADVLIEYNGARIRDGSDLRRARSAPPANRLADRDPVPKDTVRVWRDGIEQDFSVEHGPLGVAASTEDPAVALATIERLQRSPADLVPGTSVLEQLRRYGGSLPALPGTRWEAEAIRLLGSQAGMDVAVLLGQSATLPEVRDFVLGSNPPHILHLATHGLVGVPEQPESASMALTAPERATVADSGFLTLEEILDRWTGQLEECDLVVLSACRSSIGIQRGDSVLNLPLGFFAAGANTVISSLWRVDDTATALLMTRFYSNLLGQTDSPRIVDGARYEPGESLPKLDALREAQAWLRSLAAAEVQQLTGADPDAITQAASRGEIQPRRGQLIASTVVERPYEHPYYWAAFVLYGDPR